MSAVRICWCGNDKLLDFSPDYKLCAECHTLVSTQPAAQSEPCVGDDEQDFYGRQYWYKHQEQDLGFANIEQRARTDLAERCQHWLPTLLRYKLPPGKVLELGCAHGGFVAMLRAVGFDATGLELSPAIVEFAKRTFGVPMLLGPIEQQQIEPGALDLIVMMDVLEHLPDPLGTLQHCASLLKNDGLLVVQTPSLPAGCSYDQLTADEHPFRAMLLPGEHLYLFSEQSVAELFRRAGLGHIAKEPAMFAMYDMFLFAGRAPLAARTDQQVQEALLATPTGRLTLSWLDMDGQARKMRQTVSEIESDRANRLEKIEKLTAQLKKSLDKTGKIEADSAKRLENIHTLTDRVKELETQNAQIEADRADRLQQIETLTAQVKKSEAKLGKIEEDSAKRLQNIHTLTGRVKELETQNAQIDADREDRLQQIVILTAQLKKSEAKLGKIEEDSAKRLQNIQTLTDRVKELETQNARIDADRADRLKQIVTLTAQLKKSEAKVDKIEVDSAKRLEQIKTLTVKVKEQQATFDEIEADRAKRLEKIETLTAKVLQLQATNKEINADRAQRLEQIHVLTARVHQLEQLPPVSAACGENPTQEAPK